MFEGHDFRTRAYHLVGVAALFDACGAAPSANRIRRVLPRASWRSLAGVDASQTRRRPMGKGNRQPGLYTPDSSDYAWAQNFNNGNQNNNDKGAACRVRAVRK